MEEDKERELAVEEDRGTHLDRSLLEANLRLSPKERILQCQQAVEGIRRMRAAVQAHRDA